MATLAKLLQVEMGLPEMAERLAAAGRGKDSILAHINPREAKLLKAHGGSGKKNPRTGIMEFADDENESAYDKPMEDYVNQYARPANEFHPIPQGTDLTQPAPNYRTIGAAGQQGGGEVAPAPAEAAPILHKPGYWGTLGNSSEHSFEQRMIDLGIKQNSPIVVYADSARSKGREGRVAWMLLYFGASEVYMLDGGWNGWSYLFTPRDAAPSIPSKKSHNDFPDSEMPF